MTYFIFQAIIALFAVAVAIVPVTVLLLRAESGSKPVSTISTVSR